MWPPEPGCNRGKSRILHFRDSPNTKDLTTVTSGGDEKNGILGFSGVHSLKPDDSNFAVLKMGPFDPKEVSFSKAMGHLGSLGTGKMGVVSQIPSLET